MDWLSFADKSTTIVEMPSAWTDDAARALLTRSTEGGMADVFLSYKRDERPAVEQIASSLRALGLTVWFDASMSAGETFNAEIDREARAAKAILVCWSPAARQSEWVNAEAMIGFEHKKLAACYVAGPDSFSAPTPFNTSHTDDLRAWLTAPTESHSGWQSVLRRIGKLCGRADIESWGALDTRANAEGLRAWIVAHESSPLSSMVDAVLRAREVEDVERVQLEQAVRERRNSEDADRRAHQAAEGADRNGTTIAIGAVIAFSVVAVALFALSTLALFNMPSPPIQPTQGAQETRSPTTTTVSQPVPTLVEPRPASPELRLFELNCESFATLTAAVLRERFGEASVRQERGQGIEGEYWQGTVVFPDDPTHRVTFTWNEITGRPDRVVVSGEASEWVGPRGLRLGQTIAEVEHANGRSFSIYGWYWDYGGSVADWRGGTFSREPCDIGGSFSMRARGVGEAVGDNAFASDSTPVRVANPTLLNLWLDFRS